MRFNLIRRTPGQVDSTAIGLGARYIGGSKALISVRQSSSVLFRRQVTRYDLEFSKLRISILRDL
jgi:hypothetical protein